MTKKIFIVEDDVTYLEFLKTSLQSKYEIQSFLNAEDCLIALKSITPDVFILDYYLPGMSGIDLYEKIKDTLSEDIKVIILSSMDDTNLLFDFFKKGIRDYVIKDDMVIDALLDAIEDVDDESVDRFFAN